MPNDPRQRACRVSLEAAPTPDELAAITQGLVAFNRAQTGSDDYRPLTLLLRDPSDALVGGLIGATYWGWLYVDTLWVREDARGHGHGDALLRAAETEARRRGCAHAYLDTFSFQALPFYQQRGYAVFGALPDFPPGQTRHFLSKDLTAQHL